jgi:hypothetical protein
MTVHAYSIDNLVHYYNFEDVNTTNLISDAHIFNQKLEKQTTSYQYYTITGKVGNTLTTNTTNYIEFRNSTQYLTYGGDFTVNAWYYISDYQPYYYYNFFQATTYYDGFLFNFNTTTNNITGIKLFHRVNLVSITNYTNNTKQILPNTWFMLTVSYVNSTKTLTFHVNGDYYGTIILPTVINSNSVILKYFMARQNRVDELSIWNTALTDTPVFPNPVSDIDALYNSSQGLTYSQTVSNSDTEGNSSIIILYDICDGNVLCHNYIVTESTQYCPVTYGGVINQVYCTPEVCLDGNIENTVPVGLNYSGYCGVCEDACTQLSATRCFDDTHSEICREGVAGCNLWMPYQTCNTGYLCLDNYGLCTWVGVNSTTGITNGLTSEEVGGGTVSLSQGQKMMFVFITLIVLLIMCVSIGFATGMMQFGFISGIILDVLFLIFASFPTFPYVGGFVPSWIVIILGIIASGIVALFIRNSVMTRSE